MYKTILVPIDLANPGPGKAMVDHAKLLGAKNARIILINVVEDVPTYVAVELPRGLLNDLKENARKDLEDIARTAGMGAEIDVRSGHPATAILDAAQDTGADLVILASHRPGLQDYLLGSTAARVVRHARCSVLVMR